MILLIIHTILCMQCNAMESHTKKWIFCLSLKVTLKFVTLNFYQPLMITGNDSDPIKDNNNVDKIV